MIKLTVISGPDADNEFSFAGDVVVIGRSSQCDLMLHDAALGRRHCEIRCEDNVFLIVDLASVNGTYLNDQPERIKSERLRTGDEILLGRSRLRIELPESARQAPPRLPAETKPEGPELETTPQIPPRPSVFPGQPIAHQPTPPPHRVTPIASEKSPAAGKEPSSHNDFTIVGNASDQPSASISLRVIRGKDEGKTFDPSPGTERFTVGRDDAADFVLDDRRISRVHFTVELTPTGFVLIDTGSRNGTFVTGNPERIQRLELRGGEEIRVGETALQVEVVLPGVEPQIPVAETPPWQIRLEVLDGNDAGKVLAPPPGTERFTVGRGDTADFVLDDRRISRIHFAIELTPAGFFLIDEGSSNGTFIADNTERVQRHALRDGDEIRLGHTRLRTFLTGPSDATVVGPPTSLPIPPVRARNGNAPTSPQNLVQPPATVLSRLASLPRPWAALLAVFIATACCTAFLWFGKPFFFSSGAVAQGHTQWGNACMTCHSPWGIEPMRTACGTSDCHAAILQVDSRQEDQCESCHVEHRGRQFNIKGDATHCWQCHALEFRERPMWRYYGQVYLASGASERNVYRLVLPDNVEDLATWKESTPRTETGLVFAHATHAKVSGLEDCLSCHQPLPGTIINTLGTGSAFPSHAECIECHSEVGDQTPRRAQPSRQCRTCHTRDDGQITRGQATLPFVRFSHDNHKTTPCVTCHFTLATESTYKPMTRTSLYALPMEACVSCHEQEFAPTSCLTCHRSHHHMTAETKTARDWQNIPSLIGMLLFFLVAEVGTGVYLFARFRTK